jgi:DNA-binding transcriptional regulator YiaG
MNVNQFKAALKKLELSNTAFAKTIDVSLRQVFRWTSGQYPIPVAICQLVNLMIDTNTKPEDLRR